LRHFRVGKYSEENQGVPIRSVNLVQVTVKVHSLLREVVGKPTFVIKVPDNSLVEDVLNKVIDQFKNGFKQKYDLEGEWDPLKYFIISLNGMLLHGSGGLGEKVKEGDTVDILEPITGG